MKSLNEGVQNIAKSVVGEGKDKNTDKKGTSGAGEKNPFEGLEKIIGGAGFRTAAKDILSLSLNDWIKNTDFLDQLKEKLSSDANTAGETAITTTTNKGINTEAISEGITNLTNAIENFTSGTTSEIQAAIVAGQETVTAMAEQILNAKTSDETVNSINETVKSMSQNINSMSTTTATTIASIETSLGTLTTTTTDTSTTEIITGIARFACRDIF